MKCPRCQADNPDDARFCQSCGVPITPQPQAAPQQLLLPKTSGLAIAALVLGILSIFTYALTAIPAIICGIVALGRIRRSQGQLTGSGMAVAGIVVPVVSTVIIAGLIAMLLPGLARVRRQAQAIQCMANLKQWSIIVSMYTQDYDGRFWSDTNWLDTLQPYYDRDETILACPTTRQGGRPVFATWQYNNVQGSYGMNLWAMNPQPGLAVPSSDFQDYWGTPNVPHAHRVPLMLDCASPGVFPRDTDRPPEYQGQLSTNDANQMRDCCINRHDGFVNTAFMDSSVRKVGLKELWTLKWHRTYNTENPFTPDGRARPADWPEWMRKFKDY